MKLFVLTIRMTPDTTTHQEWYFENYAHFLRAKSYAADLGIYIGEREDYTTDITEFLNHLHEVGF